VIFPPLIKTSHTLGELTSVVTKVAFLIKSFIGFEKDSR